MKTKNYHHQITFGIKQEQQERADSIHKRNKEESFFKVYMSDTYRDLFEKGLLFYECNDLINEVVNVLKKQVELGRENEQLLDKISEINQLKRVLIKR